MEIISLIKSQWHWSVVGVMGGLVMLTVTLFGKDIGLSGTYRTICAFYGGGKVSTFFKLNIKAQLWNLYFAAGIILGAFLTKMFLMDANPIALSVPMQQHIHELFPKTVMNAEGGFPLMPPEIFSLGALINIKNILFIFAGGFLSGFGSTYAGGCTSGHFLAGLSNLQIPSAITLVFFCIGGIISSNIIIPFLLNHM